MTRNQQAPYPELPMDLVDAVGILGALSGGLSVLLPFFAGLTVALGGILLAAGLSRGSEAWGNADAGRTARRRYLLGFGAALAGWGFLLVHPAITGRYGAAILGVAGLPLWSIARRPQPFGGE